MNNQQLEHLKSTVESALAGANAVAGATVSSMERVAKLNLDTARDTLDHASATAKAFLSAKTAEEVRELRASLAQPTVQKAAQYAQALYAISSEAQQELAKLAEAHFAEFQQHMHAMIDRASHLAPAGSEAALAAIRDAMQHSTAAYEYLTKATRQVADVAQENIESVTQAAKGKAKAKADSV